MRPRSVARMPRADGLVVRVEDVAEGRVERRVAGELGAGARRSRRTRSCAPRCHLVGLTSGIDWTVWSSGDKGAARVSVRERTHSYRPARSPRASASLDFTRRPFAVVCNLRCGSRVLHATASWTVLPGPCCPLALSAWVNVSHEAATTVRSPSRPPDLGTRPTTGAGSVGPRLPPDGRRSSLL